MTNHFRTLLANVSFDPLSREDHIAKDFHAVTLPENLSAFRNILFSDSTDRATVLFESLSLVSCVRGTPYKSQITFYDSRITYDIDMNGAYFTAKTTDQYGAVTGSASHYDAVALYNYLKKNTMIVEKMLMATPAIDTTMYVNMWKQHTNPIYALSGLLISYISRVEYFVS